MMAGLVKAVCSELGEMFLDAVVPPFWEVKPVILLELGWDFIRNLVGPQTEMVEKIGKHPNLVEQTPPQHRAQKKKS